MLGWLWKKRRGIGSGAMGFYSRLWDTQYHIAFFLVVAGAFAFAAWVTYDPCGSVANFPIPWYSEFNPGVC